MKIDIATLKDRIDNIAENVVNQVANLIVGYAKINVPVDTGSLRDSIRRESGDEGWLTKKVRAGGYIVNPKTGRLVDYAAFVEGRYGFMESAVWQAEAEVRMLLENGFSALVSEGITVSVT